MLATRLARQLRRRDRLLRMREEENESEEGAMEDDYGSGKIGSEIGGFGKIGSEIGGFGKIGEREEIAGKEKKTQMRENMR